MNRTTRTHVVITKMAYIDSVILNLTEWSCRRFQLLTGRTNVWLAIQLTNLSIVLYFIWAGEYFLRSEDRKSTRLNSSHSQISYAVFCLKKKKKIKTSKK